MKIAPLCGAAALVFFVVFSACLIDDAAGGFGPISFAWHPVLMMLGIIAMGFALTTYAADCGVRITSILGTDKKTRRKFHGAAALLGAVLVLLAWFLAWYLHGRNEEDEEAHEDETRRRILHEMSEAPLYLQAHVWIGRLTCGAVVLQVRAGGSASVRPNAAIAVALVCRRAWVCTSTHFGSAQTRRLLPGTA